MPKTNKKLVSSNNKTKKLYEKLAGCPIGLKPFEEEFSKKIPTRELKKTNKTKTKEFVKELLSKFAPKSIQPQNDYYDYINYQWLKNVSVEKQQKYIVQIDDFRLTQDKVYHQLNEIILDYVKTHNDKLAKNLKNFYNSVIEMNPKDYSKKLCKEAEQIIDKFITEKNPWNLLAYVNSDEMISDKAPFVWSLSPDEKNTKDFCSYLTPHQFTLLDVNVYFDDGTDVSYKKNYRRMFKKYCHDLFHIALGRNDYDTDSI